MQANIQKIYEIQNIGKGIITSITPENLLLIKTNEQTTPGLQDVITEDNELTFGNTIFIDEYLEIDSDSGAQGGKTEIRHSDSVSDILPAVRIGKGIGNDLTEVSLNFFLNKSIFTDGQNSKGLEYKGDYEVNFTPRSLITKQYADGLVSVTPDATSLVKGKLKLTNDLGGTADLPTTPTAVHITGDEDIDGSKTYLQRVVLSNTSGIVFALPSAWSTGYATPMIVRTGDFIAIRGSATTTDRFGSLLDNSLLTSVDRKYQFPNKDGIFALVDDLNLQKVLTYPTDFTGTNYTITNADNNYTIIIDNAATAVTITIPTGLISKIGVGFIQKGTADVTFIASGTIINNPIGLKSKGQYYQTFIEQELTTDNYYLLGNTKV